jgi:type II secretory pathway component PulF
LLGGAWLPFFVLMIFVVPRFEPIFAKLEEKGELPSSSLWLMKLERVNEAVFPLPVLVFLTVLVLSDLGVVRAIGHRKHGMLLYWTWFAAVILLGLFACLLCAGALLLPVYGMSSTV